MNIAQVMRFDVEYCHQDDNLNLAAEKMWKGDVGCLPVINDLHQAIGIITDRDICMAVYRQGKLPADILVSDVMCKELFSCQASDTVTKVEGIMRAFKVRRLPVVDAEGKLVGIISLDDLAFEVERELAAMGHEITPEEVTATLASVSQSYKRRWQ